MILKYIGRRFVNLIPVLIILTLGVFLLMYLTPGDPALMRLAASGATITPEILEAMREEMGLNRGFFERYFDWILGVLQGDFGNSYLDDQAVLPKLMAALKNTLTLASFCVVFSSVLAIPLGIYTAINKDKWADNIARVFTFAGNAMPNFLIALLLMYFFCVKARLFPVIAKGDIKGLFLPMLSLSIPMISKFARQTRADVINQLDDEYVIGMHARGVKQRTILYMNVLHNALGSILTIICLQIRVLIGGSVITEVIFRWPGIGSMMMDAISGRDYPIVQGAVLVLSILQISVNLFNDVMYCVIDRRISLE